ncbi:MAG: hypothetical protein IEMM0008_1268 [bacterium]|nr:MAG: hypothetical protein IEMM0008_1268 [bacterium]
MKEKRKNKRLFTYPLAIQITTDTSSYIGFSTDISIQGIKMMLVGPIDKDEFMIKIPSSKGFTGTSILLKSQRLRDESCLDEKINEIACRFKEVPPEQAKILSRLIQLIENDDWPILKKEGWLEIN